MPPGAACEQLSLLSAPPYAGRVSEAVAGVDMAGQTPLPDPCSSPTERDRGKTENVNVNIIIVYTYMLAAVRSFPRVALLDLQLLTSYKYYITLLSLQTQN